MNGIWLFLSNMLCYTWGFIVARYSKGKEIKELIKEKENLQKRFNSLLEAHKICDEQNMDYATRIDKVIEYIKVSHTLKRTKPNVIFEITNEKLDKLLDILQGDDKE